MPISGRLQWAEKKCRKTHFPAQAAAAITPQDTAKASTHNVCAHTHTRAHTHTHTHTHFLIWVHCRLGSLPCRAKQSWGDTLFEGHSRSGSLTGCPPTHTQSQRTFTHPPNTLKTGIMWSRPTPYTNQIWCHMAIGPSSYCACLTAFLFRTPPLPPCL